MPARLRLIKSEEPGVQYRADARLRLWGTAVCAIAAAALTAIGYEGRLKPLMAAPLAASFLIWAAYLLVTFAEQNAQRYTLTAARLEIEQGVFRKRYESLELWRVREVLLAQTLVERLRGSGRITLLSGDPAHASTVVGPVANARALYDALVASGPASPARAQSR